MSQKHDTGANYIYQHTHITACSMAYSFDLNTKGMIFKLLSSSVKSKFILSFKIPIYE